MRRSVRWRRDVAIGLIMLVVGLVCVRLALTGEYASLVKRSLRPWLWVAGAVTTVMAGWTLWRQRTDRAGAEGHAHGRVALVGSMLLVPMLVLLVLPTPSSGLYQARRGGAQPASAPTSLAPLPAGDVVGIRIDDYVIRTTLRDPYEMKGRTFRIVGFVVNRGAGQPWLLSRLKVSCCVADALPFRVVAVGAEPLADNTWVEVVGTYLPMADNMARLQVTSTKQVPVPEQPLLA